MSRPARLLGRMRLSRVALVALLPASVPGPQLQGQVPVAEGARVVVVTGSTSGLGRETALALAAAGDHVVVHGRNETRGAEVVAEIEAAGGSARFYPADFAELAQVRALAAMLRRDYARIDVLVNNAGIARWRRPERLKSRDGYELHLQVNYLAGYLLTWELLPLLEASGAGRVIHVASRTQSPLDLDDLMLERSYSTRQAYGQSKLAQIVFTLESAPAFAARRVTVNALHPAGAMDTPLITDAGIRPQSSVLDGRAALLRLVNEEVGTGRYFFEFGEGRAHPQAYDEAFRWRFMAVSDSLVGRVRAP